MSGSISQTRRLKQAIKTAMCEKKKPNAKDLLSNLKGPDSIREKFSAIIKNNLIKIKTRKNCCGHHGEPGC
jgi:hypothetical protein